MERKLGKRRCWKHVLDCNYFKSVFNAQTEQLQDGVKSTVKETTLDSSNGFIGPTVTQLPEERLQDNVRPTIKSTTMFEYSGNGGTTVPAEMASDKYLRADLNPNKEIISQSYTHRL